MVRPAPAVLLSVLALLSSEALAGRNRGRGIPHRLARRGERAHKSGTLQPVSVPKSKSDGTLQASTDTTGTSGSQWWGGWGNWGQGGQGQTAGQGGKNPGKNSTSPAAGGSGIKQESYSSNWAGAVFDQSGAGSYQTVSGTIQLPTPSVPSGGDSGTAYTASAWVGIDGDTCDTGAILQTGVDFTIQNGAVSYDAWYEWLPDYAYDFSGISFSAGDTVTMSVSASSTSSGTATITNESTGVTVNMDLSSSTELCEQNAEWIVEDYTESGGLAPFCAFTPVTFSSTTPSASGADLIDIYQDQVLTSSAINSDGSVTVTYVGP